MNKYDVTIGIPVYNIEKYIVRMMESLMSQTYDNIEFLVLDDCGTDGSIDIIRNYQKNHPRGKDIHIVRQPVNMGLGNGRNRLIDEAQGEYIYFLDGDDAIAPNTIELLIENAKMYEADIVYGSYKQIFTDDEGRETKIINHQYEFGTYLGDDKFAEFVYRKYDGIQANTWNFIIKLSIYKDNKLRYLPINYWEDFTMTMDLPSYISKAVLLPDITYFYYCRNGSLSNYQNRTSINKDEILKTINAIKFIKHKSNRLRGKSYFAKRCHKVMMTDFYIVCTILRNYNIINPRFSKKEIRNIMTSPMTFWEIIIGRGSNLENFVLYLLGKIPSSLSLMIINIIGKRKGLI